MAILLPDALRDRAQYIADAVRRAWRPSKKEWWNGYDWHETLRTSYWTDTRVDYRRPNVGSASIVLADIQPVGVKNPKESDGVLLDSRIIDAASIEIFNKQCWMDAVTAFLADNPGGDFDDLSDSQQRYWGAVPQPWGPYQAEFEKTVSKSEAFNWSVSESLRNCFTAGNDASPVKNELELTITGTQGGSKDESESERINRSFAFNGETPAGVDERITAWRKVGRKRSMVTGTGDYEHRIHIGKHWHGHWQGGGQQWPSFADFLRTARGEAPDDFDLAREFRSHPLPDWLLQRLETPLELPYVQPLEFDEATDIQLRKVAM